MTCSFLPEANLGIVFFRDLLNISGAAEAFEILGRAIVLEDQSERVLKSEK